MDAAVYEKYVTFARAELARIGVPQDKAIRLLSLMSVPSLTTAELMAQHQASALSQLRAGDLSDTDALEELATTLPSEIPPADRRTGLVRQLEQAVNTGSERVALLACLLAAARAAHTIDQFDI